MGQTEIAVSTVVVCDAGPIIHLDELEQLVMLNDFSKILIPDTVWREVQHHRPQALLFCEKFAQRVAPTSQLSADLQATIQLFSLHAGEIQGLQIIEEYQADLFLTDDTAARLAAGSYNINVHGTLGILLRAIRRQQLSKQQVIALLESIPQKTTLHIRESLLERVIDEVKNVQ